MIDINKNPTAKDLKWFGLIFGFFFALTGYIIRYQFDAPTVAKVFWALAITVPSIYYLVPGTKKAIFVGWLYITYPQSWLMSHLVMAMTWYLIITPIGLIMRLMGRDPMQRKFDKNAASYWQPRQQAPDSSRYFKQF